MRLFADKRFSNYLHISTILLRQTPWHGILGISEYPGPISLRIVLHSLIRKSWDQVDKVFPAASSIEW
jgi:hypothetical protein